MTRFFATGCYDPGLKLFGIEDLLALVHTGLAADMVRTDHFARMLVFSHRRWRQRVVSAAHVAAGLGCFLLWNCHGLTTLY